MFIRNRRPVAARGKAFSASFRRRSAWKAGILTGLTSALYSTLMVQFGARQTGRDPEIDWMDVSTILLGDTV